MKLILFLSLAFWWTLSCSGGGGGGGSGVSSVVGTWSAITTTGAPTARSSATVHYTDFGFFIWGGDGAPGALQGGSIYDPDTDTWIDISTTNQPSERTDLYNMRETYTGSSTDKIIVWGGRDVNGYYYGSPSLFDRIDGGIYDVATDSWTDITAHAGDTDPEFAGRAYLSGVWDGSLVYFLAGNHDITLQNSTTTSFISTDDMPLASWDPGTFTDDTDDSWSIPAQNGGGSPPSNRKHAVVGYTNSGNIFVWGGCFDSCASYLSDGSVYDPISFSWTAISTTNAPSGRRFAFYTNTGTQMIIWGGIDGSGTLNDGAVYTYSTDTWTPISTINAPSARAHPGNTPWTGNSMIVWGGITNFDPGTPSFSFANDGAAYNPTTDTWTSLPDASAVLPNGVGKHQMAYGDGQVFIWSGWSGSSSFESQGAILTLNSGH